MMDQHWQLEPALPAKKKRGRPKGSKDKARQPGDKPRGRPRKVPKLATSDQRVVTAAVVNGIDGASNY